MYVIKTKFKRGEKQSKIKEGETRTAIKLLNKSSLIVILGFLKLVTQLICVRLCNDWLQGSLTTFETIEIQCLLLRRSVTLCYVLEYV